MSLSKGIVHAVERSKRKPGVIWFRGQDYTGCSISFTGLLDLPVGSVLLNKIFLRYHKVLDVGIGTSCRKDL